MSSILAGGAKKPEALELELPVSYVKEYRNGKSEKDRSRLPAGSGAGSSGQGAGVFVGALRGAPHRSIGDRSLFRDAGSQVL